MTLKAPDKRRASNPPPEGLYPAVCVDVVDDGEVDTGFGPQHKITLVFEIDLENPEFEDRYRVYQRYTLSMHQKANLRKAIDGWRGKKFTDDQAYDFDIETLVGKNAQIQVIHNITEDGRVFANVAAIVPPQKGVAAMRPSATYVRKKDRKDDESFDYGANAEKKKPEAPRPPARPAKAPAVNTATDQELSDDASEAGLTW